MSRTEYPKGSVRITLGLSIAGDERLELLQKRMMLGAQEVPAKQQTLLEFYEDCKKTKQPTLLEFYEECKEKQAKEAPKSTGMQSTAKEAPKDNKRKQQLPDFNDEGFKEWENSRLAHLRRCLEDLRKL